VQIEERLAARHIDYRFEPNYSIDAIVEAEGHQVRLIEHRAPADLVTRYAQQMKAGAVFPAIVVNERSELIDGNTRRRAALKAGRSTIPTYICRDLTPLQARALSVELNQANGLPMDEKELHAYVRSVVLEGQTLDTKTCARITGVRPSKLERWMAQAQFEQRARQCGVPDSDIALLSESAQAALNGVRLVPVLIEATAVAAAARMPLSAVRRLVSQINAATSEPAALEVVAGERAARADDIRAIASGFVARRRVGQRSAMHIAALLKFEVDDLLAVTPESREQTLTRLRDLRDHADRAITTATTRWSLDELPLVVVDSDDSGLYVQAGSRG
ncbi:MAG: ParB N-terminal domain-containing protein, partial [Steroidobacteraceae bacterium]